MVASLGSFYRRGAENVTVADGGTNSDTGAAALAALGLSAEHLLLSHASALDMPDFQFQHATLSWTNETTLKEVTGLPFTPKLVIVLGQWLDPTLGASDRDSRPTMTIGFATSMADARCAAFGGQGSPNTSASSKWVGALESGAIGGHISPTANPAVQGDIGSRDVTITQFDPASVQLTPSNLITGTAHLLIIGLE